MAKHNDKSPEYEQAFDAEMQLTSSKSVSGLDGRPVTFDDYVDQLPDEVYERAAAAGIGYVANEDGNDRISVPSDITVIGVRDFSLGKKELSGSKRNGGDKKREPADKTAMGDRELPRTTTAIDELGKPYLRFRDGLLKAIEVQTDVYSRTYADDRLILTPEDLFAAIQEAKETHHRKSFSQTEVTILNDQDGVLRNLEFYGWWKPGKVKQFRNAIREFSWTVKGATRAEKRELDKAVRDAGVKPRHPDYKRVKRETVDRLRERAQDRWVADRIEARVSCVIAPMFSACIPFLRTLPTDERRKQIAALMKAINAKDTDFVSIYFDVARNYITASAAQRSKNRAVGLKKSLGKFNQTEEVRSHQYGRGRGRSSAYVPAYALDPEKEIIEAVRNDTLRRAELHEHGFTARPRKLGTRYANRTVSVGKPWGGVGD